jgi:hypothetical protein
MSGIGHNSLAKSKSLLIEDLIKQRDNMSKEGLEELKEKKREIKLRKFDFDVNVMGKELSELRYDPGTGRKLSDENYGKLVSKIFKTIVNTDWFTRNYRQACQWAYENPEDLEKVKEDNPRCLSVLTLYMRKSKGEEEPDPESDEDNTDNNVVDQREEANGSKPVSGNSPSGQGGNTGSDETLDDLVESLTSRQTNSVGDAEREILEFNSLSDEEKINRLGGRPEVVDQKHLDQKLELDYDPLNSASAILVSLNRLRVYGGKSEIERNIMQVLSKSSRMKSYEAEALVLLGEVILENREELVSIYSNQTDLNKLN